MNWKRYVPVKQDTKYRDENGTQWKCEWRMFLTKPFCINHEVV